MAAVPSLCPGSVCVQVQEVAERVCATKLKYCICECFPVMMKHVEIMLILILNKQLPVLHNHPLLVGVKAGT